MPTSLAGKSSFQFFFLSSFVSYVFTFFFRLVSLCFRIYFPVFYIGFFANITFLYFAKIRVNYKNRIFKIKIITVSVHRRKNVLNQALYLPYSRLVLFFDFSARLSRSIEFRLIRNTIYKHRHTPYLSQ